MKKYFSSLMVCVLVAFMTLSCSVFAQTQSFLNQNTSKAPELPGNPKAGINIRQ